MKSFKQFLKDSETLQTFTPTDHQKIVLLKVLTAGTPKLAADSIVGDVEMTEAADILVQIGLLNNSPGNAEVTDQGRQVLLDLNLIDETDQPTEEANELLQQYDVEGAESDDGLGGEMDMGGEQGGGMGDISLGGPPGGMSNDPNAGMSGIPTGESYHYNTLKLFSL